MNVTQDDLDIAVQAVRAAGETVQHDAEALSRTIASQRELIDSMLRTGYTNRPYSEFQEITKAQQEALDAAMEHLFRTQREYRELRSRSDSDSNQV